MRKALFILLFFTFHLSLFTYAQSDWALGADISGYTELAANGHKWYNWKGEEREFPTLMKEMGMNAVRLRVWVEDENGLDAKGQPYSSKKDVLAKALRAKALGMDVMIDFHYSDWWADPAKQNIPKAWDKFNYKKMLKAVADHTTDVLTYLKENGVTPRWVQVGNETSNGMLWSVEMDPVTGWEVKDANGNTTITKTMGHLQHNPEQYAGFIRAGYDAVKAVFPETIVIVHLDNGFDNNLYNRNLDAVLNGGGKFDMIGMSLYPYWAMQSGAEQNAQRTIADCMKNIRLVSKKYNCDVMITETGFEIDEDNPWKMAEGREQYAEILRKAKNETGGRCKGVFYWAPECPPVHYKLGAFTRDGHPTDILRALPQDLKKYDRKVVRLATTEGDICVELYNETPAHRDNFLRLAENNSLDSTLFHRVIQDFMIQGGGPDSKFAPPTSKENPAEPTANEDVPALDGTNTLKAEILYPRFFHKRGALAAARESDEDNPELKSSSSQFYIVWGRWPAVAGKHPYVPMLDYYKDNSEAGTPWLDGGYTVFGEVIEGLEVVDSIQQMETDANDRPIKDVRILKMTVLN